MRTTIQTDLSLISFTSVKKLGECIAKILPFKEKYINLRTLESTTSIRKSKWHYHIYKSPYYSPVFFGKTSKEDRGENVVETKALEEHLKDYCFKLVFFKNYPRPLVFLFKDDSLHLSDKRKDYIKLK